MIQKTFILLFISLSFLATGVAQGQTPSQGEVTHLFKGYSEGDHSLFKELLDSEVENASLPEREELQRLQKHYKVILPSKVHQLQSLIDEIYQTVLNTRLGVNICSLFNGNANLVKYYLGNEGDVCPEIDSDPTTPFYVERGEPKNIDDASFSKRTFLFLIPKSDTKELGFSSYTTYPENVTSIILDPQLLKAASEGEPLPFILELIKTLTHEMAIILDRKQRFDELYFQYGYTYSRLLKLSPGRQKYFPTPYSDIFFALRNPLVNISLAAIRAFEVENTILLDLKTQSTNLGQYLKDTQFTSSYNPGERSCIQQVHQISGALKTSHPHILRRAYGFIHYLSFNPVDSSSSLNKLSSLYEKYIEEYFKVMGFSNFSFNVNNSSGHLYNPMEPRATQHKHPNLLAAQEKVKFSMLNPDLNFSKLPNIFQESSWKEYQKFTLNILKTKKISVNRSSVFQKKPLSLEEKRREIRRIFEVKPPLKETYSHIDFGSDEKMMDLLITLNSSPQNTLCEFLSEPLLSLVYTDTSRGPRPRINGSSGSSRPRIGPGGKSGGSTKKKRQ